MAWRSTPTGTVVYVDNSNPYFSKGDLIAIDGQRFVVSKVDGNTLTIDGRWWRLLLVDCAAWLRRKWARIRGRR